MDDGSTDDSAAVARAAGDVRLIRQPRKGPAMARNVGFANATGELIAFLDQDDVWVSTKLELQVAVILANANLGFVLARERFFVEGGAPPPAWFRLRDIDRSYVTFELGAMLVRRRTFEAVGLLDPAYTITPDSDWFFRAKDMGVPMAVVDEVLLRRRLHRDNLSSQTERSAAEVRRITLASVRRQRERAAARKSGTGPAAAPDRAGAGEGKEPAQP